MNRSLSYNLLFSGFLFLLVIVNYGVLVLKGGFYGDNLLDLYTAETGGWKGIHAYLSMDKPFASWVWYFPFKLFGHNPMFWQIGAICMKILVAISTGWLIKLTFKEFPDYLFYLAITLALVYPGFSQQPLAALYFQNQVILLLSLLSMILMVLSFQKRNKIYLAFSIVSGTVAYLTLDYFIGLELSRIAVIFLISFSIDNSLKTSLATTFKKWIPFGIPATAFVVWRFFIFKSTRAITDQSAIVNNILDQPAQELLTRVELFMSDFVDVLFLSWFQTIDNGLFSFDSKSNYVAVILLLTVPIIAYFLLQKISRKNLVSSSEFRPKQLILLGVAVIVIALLPVWFAKREIRLIGLLEIGNVDTWDRYILPAYFGIISLLTGLLGYLLKDKKRILLVGAMMLGLASSFHFRNSIIYGHYWSDLKRFCTQLYWRIPDLNPNTTIFLFGENHIYPKHSYTVGVPVNYLYADTLDEQIDFWVFNLSAKMNQPEKKYLDSLNFRNEFRTLTYNGEKDQSLFLYYDSHNSLRVLDSTTIDEVLAIPQIAREYIHLSELSTIMPMNIAGFRPYPEKFLGSTVPKNWSYYFLKAELACQFNDWRKIVDLGEKALEEGLLPTNYSETMVFIEGCFKEGEVLQGKKWIQIAESGTNHSNKIAFRNFYKRMMKLDEFNQAFSQYNFIMTLIN